MVLIEEIEENTKGCPNPAATDLKKQGSELRLVRRKIREIVQLEERAASGEVLDANQRAKVGRKIELQRRERQLFGGEPDDDPSQPEYTGTKLANALMEASGLSIFNRFGKVFSSVTDRSQDGTTALHALAGEHGKSDWVRQLLLARADVNALGGADHDSPLHTAAFQGNFECVKLLVECKADVNAVDEDGVTPLDHAELEGRRVGIPAFRCITEHLKEHGAASGKGAIDGIRGTRGVSSDAVYGGDMLGSVFT